MIYQAVFQVEPDKMKLLQKKKKNSYYSYICTFPLDLMVRKILETPP